MIMGQSEDCLSCKIRHSGPRVRVTQHWRDVTFINLPRRLVRQVHVDPRFVVADSGNPFRRDAYCLTRIPRAKFHYHLADNPSPSVNKEICELTYDAIRRYNLVTSNEARAAQMRINRFAFKAGNGWRRRDYGIISEAPQRP